MSLLATISKPKDRPVIMTICGEAGVGKTSLAAAFPKPIVLRVEDGLQSIPEQFRPDAFPELVSCEADVGAAMTALLQEPHEYKTLIIDSVTKLDTIFTQEIVDRDGKAKSINQAMGGYGAGMNMVAAMHSRLRKAAGWLNERRGMHVIFIAHADIEMVKEPESDDYMRRSLRLPTKCQAPYIDDVDVVAFVRLAMFTKGEEGERKKAVSNGDRELICHAQASAVAKNRYHITEPLPFPLGTNPLARVIPALGGRSLIGAPVAQQPQNETKTEGNAQ